MTGWLAYRIDQLIRSYAVNLLFSDQWDLYRAFLGERPWWDLFLWQHGPHRQGVAFLLSRYLADVSDWDTRAESYAVAGAILLASLVALQVKRKVVGPITLLDAAIPLAFLTLARSRLSSWFQTLHTAPRRCCS